MLSAYQCYVLAIEMMGVDWVADEDGGFIVSHNVRYVGRYRTWARARRAIVDVFRSELELIISGYKKGVGDDNMS
jgi:hypothetical protein